MGGGRRLPERGVLGKIAQGPSEERPRAWSFNLPTLAAAQRHSHPNQPELIPNAPQPTQKPQYACPAVWLRSRWRQDHQEDRRSLGSQSN